MLMKLYHCLNKFSNLINKYNYKILYNSTHINVKYMINIMYILSYTIFNYDFK